jgi:transposase
VPKRQYTEEFKTEAVRPAQSIGQHEAARLLGVPMATLGNWTRRERNLGGQSEFVYANAVLNSVPLKVSLHECCW